MGDYITPAIYGLTSYLGAKEQASAAQTAAQPLPTYFQEYISPQQQQMWETLYPTIQTMQRGPTEGWYAGLDPNIRAGIEEPYVRAMDLMRNQLGGIGMLGSPTAGISGAAADVFAQYAQKAAPTMAQTGWNMMMGPYQAAMGLIPTTYSDLLVGHTPTIQQIQPGAPLPPDYQSQLQSLMAGIMPQTYPTYTDWGLGAVGTEGMAGLGYGLGTAADVGAGLMM